MYKANLSGEQNSYYLQELLFSGLIAQEETDDGCLVYRTTQKGREYLGHYYQMMELMEIVQGRVGKVVAPALAGESVIFPSKKLFLSSEKQ